MMIDTIDLHHMTDIIDLLHPVDIPFHTIEMIPLECVTPFIIDLLPPITDILLHVEILRETNLGRRRGPIVDQDHGGISKETKSR